MPYKPLYTEPMSIDVLRRLLRYDPTTGEMFWKTRALSCFPNQALWKTWNARFAGKPAFSARCANGYRSGAVFGKTYRGHRVAMALHLGRLLRDDEHIDHVNGDRADNRAANMRLVTRTQNMRNSKRPSDNTSGHIGVTRYKTASGFGWQVRIGKTHVGCFPTFEAAVAARKRAERAHGYHQNHGR